MSKHPNVAVVDRMTKAIFDNDRETLVGLFTDDMELHVRGPLPCVGDHAGVDAFLAALGRIFEATDGNVKIEQLFLLADDQWAAEWEQASFGRNGRSLEAKNVFTYRFEAGRISEMWMTCTAPAEADSFWA